MYFQNRKEYQEKGVGLRNMVNTEIDKIYQLFSDLDLVKNYYKKTP